MSAKMLRIPEINWADVIASGESPIDFCLRNDIPAYFRVNKDHQCVRCHYRLRMGLHKKIVFQQVDKFSLRGPGWKTNRLILLGEYITEDFHDDLLFLRLDNASLAEIAATGLSIVSSFSDKGFFIPRPFSVIGHTPRGHQIVKYEKIRTPILEKVEFDRAFLVDKAGWELASSRGLRNDFLPEAFTVSIKIGEDDLWFASADIDALRKNAQNDREMVPYPFKHKERMPGIYWMFQAAYAHNKLGKMKRGDVEVWLKSRAPSKTYRYKSYRTAKKFVWLELDRAKGGGDRGDFSLEAFDGVTDAERYKFDYVGKGLSVILSIADWWVRFYKDGPDESKLPLAKQLDANRFEGLEVGDLIYLISGWRISEEDVKSFVKHQQEIGRKVRPIVDGS